MTHRTMSMALLLGVTLAVAGCATTGAGIGFASTGQHKVLFKWKSSGDVSGSMTASLSNGTIYSGEYFQITSDTLLSGIGPLGFGWGPEWGMNEWGGDDWDEWYPGPQFMTHYSGRVVANLSSVYGTHMRCRFRLIHPADGMAGGGRGICGLPDGSRIHAQFPGA